MGDRLIRIASLSDIHWFHRRTHTAEIIDKLDRAFPDDAETAQLDFIFLVGDLFDMGVHYADENTSHVNRYVIRLLTLCKKHDITLVILEGTESHDRRQSKVFVDLNDSTGINAKLRYVTTVSIEFFEDYGINVLCVPDRITETAGHMFDEIKALMRAKGLQQVDFALVHGTFLYQAVEGCNLELCHDQDAFAEIVRDTTFVGHTHAFSTYKDTLVTHGSFDRLGFGYESPKGHVRLVTNLNGFRELRFIENKEAKLYTTIDLYDHDLETTLRLITERINGAPDDSWFRLRGPAENPVFANMNLLIRTYPFINWETKPIVKTGKTEAELFFDKDSSEYTYQPLQLTRENLPAMLLSRVAQKCNEAAVMQAAERILQEVI